MRAYLSISYILERVFAFIAIVFLILSFLPAVQAEATKALVLTFVGFLLAVVCLAVADIVVGRHAKRNGVEIFCKPYKKIKTVYLYIVLTFLLLMMLLPFYVIFITSIKNSQEANLVEFSWWPKLGVNTQSYVEVWESRTTATTLLKSFANTMITSLPTSIITVFTSSLSAYAFARLKFRGKNILFSVLMFSMMAPACITLTTSYIIFDSIGWVNTFKPLIIPSLFGGASIVFFMRQYFMGIPQEIFDSAKIDGLGKMGVFFRVLMPLSYPAYLAQFILTFIAKYNDYLGPLLYLQRPESYTLSIYLKFFSGAASAQAEIVSAACVITILPLVILYIIFQKRILSGLAMSSGLK